MTQNNEQNADKIHNNLSVLQKIRVSSSSLNEKHWYDGISSQIADFLTSVLLIMLIMIVFLSGIAIHIKAVFDSWFLAIGFQSVVLLTSVNSDLLPKYKQLPIIAMCMSVLTCIFVFLSFDGHLSSGVMLVVNIIKSVAIAGVEFVFAYLFTARNNRTKAEKRGYEFDLEGNVIAEPGDKQQQTEKQTEKPAEQPIVQPIVEQEKPIEHIDVEQPIEQSHEHEFDVSCECGLKFNNKDEYDEHISKCDIHQWFNDKKPEVE